MQQADLAEWLFAEDLQREYRMGRSKSYLILSQIPGAVRIGKRKAIRRSTLEMHLDQHGAIDIEWPKRKR